LGRFTTIDIAGPDLLNPQTLNKYQFCLNNPLKYLDKNGKYEEDVHRDLTRALAYAVGFSMKDATAIADATQRIDDAEETDPTNFKRITSAKAYFEFTDMLAEYHFTTEETRNKHWKNFENSAFFAKLALESPTFWDPKGENRPEAVKLLGVFLHAQQDSFSHEGYGKYIGHSLQTLASIFSDKYKSPDKTFNDPTKAMNMALDTYNRLIKAASLLGGTSNPVPFEAIIKEIGVFNRAKTDEEKQSAIRGIIAAVTRYRTREYKERVRPVCTRNGN
jgi:hypothetical protein